MVLTAFGLSTVAVSRDSTCARRRFFQQSRHEEATQYFSSFVSRYEQSQWQLQIKFIFVVIGRVAQCWFGSSVSCDIAKDQLSSYNGGVPSQRFTCFTF